MEYAERRLTDSLRPMATMHLDLSGTLLEILTGKR
jgi:hypothetical protein